MVMLSLLKYRDAKLSADCRNIGLWGNIRMQYIIGQSRSSGVEEPEPPYFLARAKLCMGGGSSVRHTGLVFGLVPPPLKL